MKGLWLVFVRIGKCVFANGFKCKKGNCFGGPNRRPNAHQNAQDGYDPRIPRTFGSTTTEGLIFPSLFVSWISFCSGRQSTAIIIVMAGSLFLSGRCRIARRWSIASTIRISTVAGHVACCCCCCWFYCSEGR